MPFRDFVAINAFLIFCLIAAIIWFLTCWLMHKKELKDNEEYEALKKEVLSKLGFICFYNVNHRDKDFISKLDLMCIDKIKYHDESIIVKSRTALANYDEIKFFKEDKERLAHADNIIKQKTKIKDILKNFLKNNDYTTHRQYDRLSTDLNEILLNTKYFRISVVYITPAGNELDNKTISLSQNDINKFKNDPSLLMTKGEYNKYKKEIEKQELDDKKSMYYDRVNKLITLANEYQNKLVIKNDSLLLEDSAIKLFDRTVNSINKIKSIDSEEWGIIGVYIDKREVEINDIVNRNQQILDYYDSVEFLKIKEVCSTLMNSQKEFNEYIKGKIEFISHLFGKKVIREETVVEDEYEYIRPFKKTISPFTAEVSAAVFSSAENNPIEYVIKHFYPNKEMYPEQIQNLQSLIEELDTLREAKQIIDNYKAEYQQYLKEVPNYIIENDEGGFYSRLGFANIDDNVLTVEYQFSYTSNGGKAKRYFPVPMTTDTIISLINALENKLTISAFTKEQRALMTNNMREAIKRRDNFTCCNCGNSIHNEPNLLLEIDHIIPVSKGGLTVENNLQTLCWKCNRAKSSKLHI